MRFGFGLPQGSGFDLRYDVVRVARGAERAGYSSLWVYERVLYPLEPADGMNGVPGLPWIDHYRECADALTVLTLAAAVTDTVRLGTSILVAPFYSSLHLARALAALDQASGGRVIAGFGSGWSSDEYRGMEADFGARGRTLDETVDACRAFWGTNPVSYRDSRVTVENALVSPKPVSRIPVMLGGGRSERAVDRIARKADGWLPSGLPAPAVADLWARIRERAAGYGRDADALELIPRAAVVLSETPGATGRRPFQGSLEQVVEDVAALAGAGADEILLDLTPSAKNGDELLDRSLEVFEALTDARL
ncbi:TIGR03619 family F420-dependent LLM class oxidoreductase [Streptosporangium sp. NPDC051023]|uniref:TIGR03619 family F420-dependent LLM class oxidoreductase n=1 Tax=Streptosporangium sp. NPDC051023 TaxID=3155410 RepID=UPI00344F7C79